MSIEKLLDDPDYDVRTDGTIWSKARNTDWVQVGTKSPSNGYHYVCYCNGPRLMVSRIVYRKFNGELIPGMTIDHVDGDADNNRPENLEQMTHADNIRRGPNIKLSMEIVREIRSRYTGAYGEKRAMAQEYGISETMMYNIIHNRVWKEI